MKNEKLRIRSVVKYLHEGLQEADRELADESFELPVCEARARAKLEGSARVVMTDCENWLREMATAAGGQAFDDALGQERR